MATFQIYQSAHLRGTGLGIPSSNFEELSTELNGLRWVNKNTRLVKRGKGTMSVVACEAMGGEETECGDIQITGSV